MNVCLLVLGVLVGCGGSARPGAPGGAEPGRPAEAPPAPAGHAAAMGTPAPDAWIGEDKLQHFALSFTSAAFGYGTARLALEPDPALAAAGAAALAAGVGKELADVRRGGPFSLKDLAWDAAGVAAALLLSTEIR